MNGKQSRAEVITHYEEEDNGRASLRSKFDGKDDLTDFFRLSKQIQIDDTELDITVAYQLDDNGKVRPVDDKRLFVFFPTVMETGFQFLVHAPYKTTPNRETIPFDDEQNKAITTTVSDCIAESILAMKEDGLLSVDVLSMLPIDAKKRAPFV